MPTELPPAEASRAETSHPDVIEDVRSLRKAVAGWRAAGARIALVPTMGALHEGHLALVAEAKQRAERVVVSIFVNPAQFGPNEDFSRYPRTFDADKAKLDAAGTDAIFFPAVAEMYPAGFASTVSVAGPATAGLEDRFRPTHFDGVATVVTKLFTQVMPDVALFGAKDYQQVQVVTRAARDLDLPVEVVAVDTVREPDGLALSSRNRYLSPDERNAAPALHAALAACAGAIASGSALDSALDTARATVTGAGFDLDYLEARNAVTLAPVDGPDEPIRLLVAARIGTTRLIDNLAVPPADLQET